MTIKTSQAPTAFAYFEVYVPVQGRYTYGDAERIVDRYLYGGFSVGTPKYRDEDMAYVVPVTFVEYSPMRSPETSVQQQRDRFASGMYVTSEPVFYQSKEA